MTDITQLPLWEQLIYYYQMNGAYVFDQFLRHFLMAIYGMLFAAIFAIPFGFYLARNAKIADWILAIANVIQTVPSLAMLSILMLAVGLGPNLVVITVFIYSVLPIIRNTYMVVQNVDEIIFEVVKGMGMTKWQLFYKVVLHLFLSVIMGGVRNAFTMGVGVATLGTFFGASGLGDILQLCVNA